MDRWMDGWIDGLVGINMGLIKSIGLEQQS